MAPSWKKSRGTERKDGINSRPQRGFVYLKAGLQDSRDERWEGKLSSRRFKRHNCSRVCQNNIIQGILHICRVNKVQQRLNCYLHGGLHTL